MPTMTGAQALVQSLLREGVEVVFGLPGVQIMAAFDALYDATSLRLVTVRHEQAAAYMADGYARAAGKVGVALVVPGPGALNAAAALGTAYAVSSPVLLISGQMESYNLGRQTGALHEIEDQLEVFRPITKWNARTTKPEEIPYLLHLAMQQLVDGRPRPVELEIPWDTLPAPADIQLLEREGPVKQSPDPAKIRQAAELLAGAERPLIWAGGGCHAAGLSDELVELAVAVNAPVITTPEGKGVIPENHPNSLGAFYYGHGPGWLALPQADVILAVGSRLNLAPNPPWSIQPHQQLIRIDADPAELTRNHPPHIGIVADALLGVRELLAEIGGRRQASQWQAAELESIRQQRDAALRELAPLQLEIIAAIRQELDADAMLVSGVTEIGYWSNLAFPVWQPRSYLTSGYFATLGYAFPTALGAKVGCPDRQVVAISGDGGFMYNVQELATAVMYGINAVVVVFNDSAFGNVMRDQTVRFNGRVYGSKLHNPDFVKLAESFGARGVRVERENADALHSALGEALATDAPTLIEVPVGVMPYPY